MSEIEGSSCRHFQESDSDELSISVVRYDAKRNMVHQAATEPQAAKWRRKTDPESPKLTENAKGNSKGSESDEPVDEGPISNAGNEYILEDDPYYPGKIIDMLMGTTKEEAKRIDEQMRRIAEQLSLRTKFRRIAACLQDISVSISKLADSMSAIKNILEKN